MEQGGIQPNPDHDVNEEDPRQQDSGPHACDQQLAGRDPSQCSDDDGQNTWRNDRVKRGATENRSDRKPLVVTPLDQRGIERAAQQAGNRHRCARQCSEYRRQNDAQNILPAADASDKPVKRLEQRFHRSGAKQNLAHDDEQRNSGQGRVGRGRVDAVGEQAEARGPEVDKDANEIQDQERDKDRRPDDEQRNQQANPAGERKTPGHDISSSVGICSPNSCRKR
jgi:hypothetical protein